MSKTSSIKGMSTLATIITASAMVVGSIFTSWTVADGKIQAIESNVRNVQTVENLHYLEIKESLQRIEQKINSNPQRSSVSPVVPIVVE